MCETNVEEIRVSLQDRRHRDSIMPIVHHPLSRWKGKHTCVDCKWARRLGPVEQPLNQLLRVEIGVRFQCGHEDEDVRDRKNNAIFDIGIGRQGCDAWTEKDTDDLGSNFH